MNRPPNRQQIQFPAKHAALREDVHELGAIMGAILREQGGDALFELVEGDRLASIARREHATAESSLSERVRGRAPPVARDLVRAFSSWFQAENLAEKVHRIRRRRQYFQEDSAKPQPGGVEDALARLKAEGLSLDQVLDLLGTLHIEPVLIAHPTESTRRTQLRRQQRIADVQLDRLNPSFVLQEVRSI